MHLDSQKTWLENTVPLTMHVTLTFSYQYNSKDPKISQEYKCLYSKH